VTHVEYFIVFDDGARACVYGVRDKSRDVASGKYEDALSDKGRMRGLVGWRRREFAERHQKRFYFPTKIVELPIASWKAHE
jgi:hypothetical protein